MALRLEKNRDGSYKVWMNKEDYRDLIKSAGSTKDYLVCRLGAECGLRSFEVNQIKPKHIKDSFLEVPSGKDTSGELDGKTRSTFLSEDLRTQLLMYQNDNKINQDELFFDVSNKSIRNAVKRTAIRAAERTGKIDYKKVSSHDLRRFFAHYLLTEKRMNPEVVMDVGGWEDYQSIKPYLNKPSEKTIKKEFERIGWN